MDVVNEILQDISCRDILCKDDKAIKEIIDELVILVRELLCSVKTPRVEFISESNGAEETIDLSSTVDDECDEIAPLYGDNHDNKTSEEMHRQFKSFITYGFKFAISFGLIATDCEIAQTRIGDRGGIAILVELMSSFPEIPSFSKWACWALTHLTVMHPPNKREFFEQRGIPVVITSLAKNATEPDLYQQGLGLLFAILSPDPNTKLSLSKARNMALANGLVDVLHRAQRNFKDVQNVDQLCRNILDFLIADFS